MNEIAGFNWWWFLLAISNNIVDILGIDNLNGIATLASILAEFNIYYNVAKKFQKTNRTAVLAGIFPFIFILIFGLSKNTVYDVNVPVSKNGVFGQPDNNFTNNNQDVQNNMTQLTNEDNSNQHNSFCVNCGTKLGDNIKYCPKCGKEKL